MPVPIQMSRSDSGRSSSPGFRFTVRPRRGLLGALLVLVACQNYGPLRIDVQHDEAADFSRYASFALAPAPESADPAEELRMQRLRRWIGQDLASKGLGEEAWDEADLWVAFGVGAQPHVYYNDWSANSPWWGPQGVSVAQLVAGTLQIDIADRRSQELVWHGTASQETLDDRFDPERARHAVVRLLEGFPPTAATE